MSKYCIDHSKMMGFCMKSACKVTGNMPIRVLVDDHTLKESNLFMIRDICANALENTSYWARKTPRYIFLYFLTLCAYNDDVIKWKHFPRYWPFVQGIHRRPVNSPHKGQWRRALMCSLICDWINGWVINHEDGDLRRHRAYYDVTVM